MESNITKLLQRLRSVCRVQQEEREQQEAARLRTIKNDLRPSIPDRPVAPAEQAGVDRPKLRDFLHLMKKDRNTDQVLPSAAAASSMEVAKYGNSRMPSEQSQVHSYLNSDGKYPVGLNQDPAAYNYLDPLAGIGHAAGAGYPSSATAPAAQLSIGAGYPDSSSEAHVTGGGYGDAASASSMAAAYSTNTAPIPAVGYPASFRYSSVPSTAAPTPYGYYPPMQSYYAGAASEHRASPSLASYPVATAANSQMPYPEASAPAPQPSYPVATAATSQVSYPVATAPVAQASYPVTTTVASQVSYPDPTAANSRLPYSVTTPAAQIPYPVGTTAAQQVSYSIPTTVSSQMYPFGSSVAGQLSYPVTTMVAGYSTATTSTTTTITGDGMYAGMHYQYGYHGTDVSAQQSKYDATVPFGYGGYSSGAAPNNYDPPASSMPATTHAAAAVPAFSYPLPAADISTSIAYRYDAPSAVGCHYAAHSAYPSTTTGTSQSLYHPAFAASSVVYGNSTATTAASDYRYFPMTPSLSHYQHYPYAPDKEATVAPAATVANPYYSSTPYYPNGYAVYPTMAPTVAPVPSATQVNSAPVPVGASATKVSSNVELLSLLDQSVPMSPSSALLEPTPRGMSGSNSTTNTVTTTLPKTMVEQTSPDDTKTLPIISPSLSNNFPATTPADVLGTAQVAPGKFSFFCSLLVLVYLVNNLFFSNMRVCMGTVVAAKDPLIDADFTARLAAEVDKLDKLVEGLTRKSLNGPTPLDVKWKEVQDLQDKESTKRSISVARCYPMKNRFPDVLPYDHNRVELPTTKDDYINASRITLHSASSPSFIATQCPLACSLQDFWAMVWQQQVETIVCLLSDTEMKGSVYWPLDKAHDVVSGNWLVSLQSTNQRPYSVQRILTLTKQVDNYCIFSR